jgi:hypothetical protein
MSAEPGNLPAESNWRRAGLCGGALGLAFALLVALLMTGIDWHHNPGGVFRNQDGLNRSALLETACSWFLPAAALCAPAAAAIAALPGWLQRNSGK